MILLPASQGQAALIAHEIEAIVESACSDCPPPNNVDRRELFLEPGDTTVLETLLNYPSSRRQPYGSFRTNNLSGTFISAAMSAQDPIGMSAGVGVSGILGGAPVEASARYSQRIENAGDQAINPIFDFVIPSIQLLKYREDDLSNFFPPAAANDQPFAFARADLNVFRQDANTGEYSAQENVFIFTALIREINYGYNLASLELTLSPDLESLVRESPELLAEVEQRAYPDAPFSDSLIAGYVFDEILGNFSLALAPNETVFLDYDLLVFASCPVAPGQPLCDDAIAGFHATIGDPLSVRDVGPLISLRDVDPAAPVPAPASAPLIALALPLMLRRGLAWKRPERSAS
jgi:hypothetical protein